MMSMKDRARQFAPFDALKGLHEEIDKRIEMRTRVEKIELSDEMQKEISEFLENLKVMQSVKVEYFLFGHYQKISGEVNKIDFQKETLIVKNLTISFQDIYKISYLV